MNLHALRSLERSAARQADLAMEAYRMRQEQPAEDEAEEPEPEPLVEAIEQAVSAQSISDAENIP